MAKQKRPTPQNVGTPQPYPRINDPKSRYNGLLDTDQLVPHTQKIAVERLTQLINQAIDHANRKSRREVILVPPDATEEERRAIYRKEGEELFKYFHSYANDPASTAHQMYQKNYRNVGLELFRNKTLQRERMNSGWRYQFLSASCARESTRFQSVSGLATAEADFNAQISQVNGGDPVNLYVSVKNRSNTLGGQDWPKAIYALEVLAVQDQNKIGPYCCVFGIAMDRGTRRQSKSKKDKRPYSVNTEIWLSDFFWPFFTNYSYEEMMVYVFEVLRVEEPPNEEELATQVEVPEETLETFRAACLEAELVNEEGYFHDPMRLITFLCKAKARKRKTSGKGKAGSNKVRKKR
jgi:hypothetical protein